jgi:pyrroline-5-carboxylate reductase
MPEGADADVLPGSIGLVGVGTIGSAVIRGLCSPGQGAPARIPRIVISPRGAEKAAALKAALPAHVTIAGSNQEVVDSVDCVIVAVLVKQADEVLKSLKFREGQKLLSLMAGVMPSKLQELAPPVTDCASAIPLPAVAKRRGTSLLTPSKPWAKAIFEVCGGCVAVDDDAQFKRMLCVTGLMGDFYKRQLTIQGWLTSHGVPEAEAGAWTGATFATFAADSAQAEVDTFHKVVEEHTPGGLNEMVWRSQDEDKSYQSLLYQMDAVHHRIVKGAADPDLPSLAPAAKRARM